MSASIRYGIEKEYDGDDDCIIIEIVIGSLGHETILKFDKEEYQEFKKELSEIDAALEMEPLYNGTEQVQESSSG